MAAERKISDEELARLRELAANGWIPRDLAEAFGVSVQHVGRLIRGEQRPSIASPDQDAGAEPGPGGVLEAVETFLEDVRLRDGDGVLAATARVLAGKLDGAAASESATAAAAMPRLSAQLVDVLARLREGVPREPDFVDALRERRAARLLAVRVRANGNGTGGH